MRNDRIGRVWHTHWARMAHSLVALPPRPMLSVGTLIGSPLLRWVKGVGVRSSKARLLPGDGAQCLQPLERVVHRSDLDVARLSDVVLLRPADQPLTSPPPEVAGYSNIGRIESFLFKDPVEPLDRSGGAIAKLGDCR